MSRKLPPLPPDDYLPPEPDIIKPGEPRAESGGDHRPLNEAKSPMHSQNPADNGVVTEPTLPDMPTYVQIAPENGGCCWHEKINGETVAVIAHAPRRPWE